MAVAGVAVGRCRYRGRPPCQPASGYVVIYGMKPGDVTCRLGSWFGLGLGLGLVILPTMD